MDFTKENLPRYLEFEQLQKEKEEKAKKEKEEKEKETVTNPDLQEKTNGTTGNNDAELAKKFYDFIKYPPLQCTFLGVGETVKFSTYEIKTWIVKDEKGYEWYIPQWQTFNEPKANFAGFKSEKPNDGHIYLITYKGKKELGNGGYVHICEVLKKLPYGKQ